MRAAVYNRFLQSMGGGERHSSMIAQVLAADGYEAGAVGADRLVQRLAEVVPQCHRSATRSAWGAPARTPSA